MNNAKIGIPVDKIKVSNVDNFTSDIGMNIRKKTDFIVRALFKRGTKTKFNIERYPNLEKGKPYIFASTHSFVDDPIAGFVVSDRNAYMLFGTTDQLEHNPLILIALWNGLIYVDRLNPKSREQALPKMERVLNNGNSVVLFPEGAFNNTENLLIQGLFSGVYHLSKNTGVEVVPIIAFKELNNRNSYIKVEDPLDFSQKTEREALIELRDCMASGMYEMFLKHTTPLKRAELGDDPRLDFMEERRLEYLGVKWTRDVWEEELSVNKLDKDNPAPKEIRATLKDVELTVKNAKIFAPTFAEIEKDERYDFISYMKKNWQKKPYWYK